MNDRFHYAFAWFWNKVYHLYYEHKWFSLLVNLILLYVPVSLYGTGHWFKALIALACYFGWRHFCLPSFGHDYKSSMFIGIPGSGKSTLAAFMATQLRFQGVKVFANLDLYDTYEYSWKEDFGVYDMDDSYIIVDEAALEDGLYNRDFKNNYKGTSDPKFEQLKKFRHSKIDISCFSQADDIDIKLKQMIENYYLLKKTPFHWLVVFTKYRTVIGLDPLTKDFRIEREPVPFSTKILFSPCVWLEFDTLEHEKLPSKDFALRTR